ncbi:MAG TPA: ATP-binding protein [Thermoanaerobaculia bacterium]|nr:ATP-binding protein [Thermoanaerobaculia bacterium]
MRTGRLLQYRKDPRIVIAVPVVIFTATSLIYYLMQRAKELSPEALSSRLLLFALWNINVILILGILFVFIRDLVKLVLERQRGILGSRFRTKLVTTYVVTSLVPMVLLFFVATNFLRVSIDGFFNTPVRKILRNSAAIAEDSQQRAIQQAIRGTEEIARGLQSTPPRDLDDLLSHVRQSQNVDLAGVYENGSLVRLLANPRAPVQEISEPSARFFTDVATTKRAEKIDLSPHGKWVRRGLLVRGGPNQLIAVTGIFIPDVINRMIDENIIAQKSFEQFDSQRGALKALQTSVFLTVVLYILFGTLWTAILVSRRITAPVQALAEGTRTLAAGNYTHRISFRATDEIGLLIDSFNTMAEQLESQRTALTESNRELQRVNENLDEERAYLSTVLDSVSTGIITFTEELEFLSVNRAAQRMLQLEPPAPMTPLTTVFRGELDSLARYIRDARDREPRPREVTLIRGGEIRYLEVSAARLSGATLDRGGWVLAIEDSTQLVQAQKLAAWSEAARRIAHEIKNPLTPIQLSAERIAKKYKNRDRDVDVAIEEGCRTIVAEVGQLKRMVDEFSRFARMPAVHLRQSSIGEIVRDVALLYREVKSGVEVRADVDSDFHALVDPEQIRRALINLLDNAIEATDEGTISIVARKRGKAIRIEVVDSGRGVPDSDKEKLFLPYFSTKEKGTGLGLAIVHRIVNDHEGRISVHDNSPRGTRFEIDLPA